MVSFLSDKRICNIYVIPRGIATKAPHIHMYGTSLKDFVPDREIAQVDGKFYYENVVRSHLE